MSAVTPEGLSSSAWDQLARQAGDCWTIPERNASGEVTGTAIRAADGSKDFEAGGKRGLVLAWPLPAYAGTSPDDPILLCEGATDTAAAMTLGFTAVGLPAAGMVVDQAAELLTGRHVVVTNDRDEAGASSLKKVMATVGATAASMRAIQPPSGVKDLRDWVRGGATREMVSAAIGTAPKIPKPDSFRSIGVKSERNEFRFISIEELPEPTPIDWIWDGYLAPKHITLFVGKWKAGKTTVLTQLMGDLGTGHGLAARKLTSKILVVSEESNDTWARRRKKYSLGSGIEILHRKSFGRLSTRDWETLCDFIAQMVASEGIELVLIDTINHIWPVSQENDAGEVSAALAPTRAISEAGASLLLTHHPSKGEAALGASSRGSGALPGFVDIILEMDFVKGRTTQRMFKALGRADDIPSEQVFDFIDGRYVLLGEPNAANQARLSTAITAVLRGAGTPHTVDEVRSALPETARPGLLAVRAALKTGATEGAWVQSGKGCRGDPHRYAMIKSGSDSFLSDTPPVERNESDPEYLPEIGGAQ